MTSKQVPDAFIRLRGCSARARYLAYVMLRDDLLPANGASSYEGGVRRLAMQVGFSPAALKSALDSLVAASFLLAAKQKTPGRPVITYRLASVELAAKYRGRRSVQASRALNDYADELSIPERVLLADLWLELDRHRSRNSDKACVLDGVSIRKIAKHSLQSKATTHRLLANLESKGFIFSHRALFSTDSVAGVGNTYYLLGPAVTKALSVEKHEIQLSSVLTDFLSPKLNVDALLSAIAPKNWRADTQGISAALRWLAVPCLKEQLIQCICAGVSNHPSWSMPSWMNQMILDAQAFCLRCSEMGEYVTPWFSGIENLKPSDGDEIFEAIEMLAAHVATEVYKSLASSSCLKESWRKTSPKLFFMSIVDSLDVNRRIVGYLIAKPSITSELD